MQILLMTMLALLVLTAAGYVQQKLPHFTKSGGRVMAVRALLMLVGVAFGLLAARDFEPRAVQFLAFLIGFGTVHVPAAVILLIKSRRGEGKS